MVFLQDLLIQTITITSPIIIYIIYEILTFKEKKERKNSIIIPLLISNAIAFIVYSERFSYISILINIPLIIMALKGYNYLSLFIIIINIIFYKYNFDYSLQILILEYSFYIIVFRVLQNKTTHNTLIPLLILSKGIFMIAQYLYLDVSSIIDSLLFMIVTVILFYLTVILISWSLMKKEEVEDKLIINKSLEMETRFKNYMFKVAHEIKNPLSVCRGYLDMINPKDIDKSNKYISIMKNEIARALSILEDTLNSSKIKLNKEIIDINLLIEETIETHKELFKSKNIELLHKNKNAEILIEGDYNRLKQVITNMLKNAMESKKENEILRITISIKKISDNINIIIKDNGIGMNESVLENIGKEFFTTKKYGTGLGVSISKEIIKKHNGELLYESVKDKGTTATIILPTFKEK